MQPYKRGSRKRSVSGVLGRAVLITLGVIILFFIIRAIVRTTGVPSLHADDLREQLESKKGLIARISTLEDQLQTAQAAIDEAALLRHENEQLKAEFNRSAPHQGTLARVLTTPDRTFYGTLIIDAGDAEGITVGQIAYAFGSIALGTISEVRASQSTVELFSAPSRETAGTAEGSATTVSLIGRGAGEFEVRMPRDVHFTVGEFISLQSVHTAVLAKIERIATDPRDPFQRLLAKAPVNLQALKFVIVR